MKIVIWWNIPCKAISGVIKELSKINNNEVIAITGRLSDSRKNMGWEENTFSPAKHIFIEDNEWDSKAKDLLNEYSGCFHIFSGFYSPKRINTLIKRAIKQKIRFGIFSEAPSNPYAGFKSLAAKIYHTYILPFKTLSVTHNAEFIFCLSGSQYEELRKLKRLGWSAEKIIPFGYFTEDILQINHRIPNDIPEIYCSGNLVPHKGVDILIRALKIADEQQINFHCHITGQGPEKEKLIKLTKDLGLDKKITFHGVLNQECFNNLQREMDILVAPGRIEPWGMRINEAIQNGQAVIASNKIGAKELILASGGGAIFKSGNYIDLSNKLLPYLKDKELLQKGQTLNLEYKSKIAPSNISLYVQEVLNSLHENKKYPNPTWL